MALATRRSPRPVWAALLVGGAAFAVLLPAACVSREERVCDVTCDCTGCSEARYLDCVEEATAGRDRASELGCPAAFEDYTACLEEEIECRNDAFSYDGCEEEEAKLRDCGVTVFRSACELANEHQMNECQVGPFAGGSFDPCTGTLECQAKCTLEVSCAGLTGQSPEENRRFNECVSRC